MPSLELLTKLAVEPSQRVSFIEDRCLRRRLSTCDCADCLKVCPADSLSIHKNQIRFSADICTGCMICTSVCPNDAFSITGFNLEQLTESLPRQKVIVFSCSRQAQIYPEERAIPCLACLSVPHLLALAMKRTGVTIFSVSGCHDCVNKPAAEIFVKSVKWLRERSIGSLTLHFEILTVPEQIDVFKAENRRSYLSGVKRNLISTLHAQMKRDSIQKENLKSRHRRVPSRVKLVGDLLEQANHKQKKLVSSLCVYDLKINENCKICPLCKGICPTGAITIDSSDNERELLIENSLCSGCGLCVTFCKKDALTLHSPTSKLCFTKTDDAPISETGTAI